MRILNLKPRIFQGFPEIQVSFQRVKKDLTPEDLPNLVMARQVHGDKIVYATSPEYDLEVDGMITDQANLPLAIRTADCLPGLFYNKTARVIGAVHAGWRGTQREVLKKAIKLVQDKFHAPIADFYFYFGPAGRVCCYDLKKYSNHMDKFKYFSKEIIEREGKKFLDFVGANKRQLKELGIKEEQIEDSGICTIHNREYPSHRREGQTRRETILSIIGLK